MNIQPKITPVLDPGFVPAVLWNQAFEAKAAADPASHQVDIALTRNDGTCFRWSGKLLPHTGENVALNETYVERIVKFLLWQKGGNIILVAGDDAIADMLASRYCKGGAREFDWDFIGKKIYGSPIEVKKVSVEELPEEYSGSMTLGRNLDGYRIGFDLGGSDRKCAAVVAVLEGIVDSTNVGAIFRSAAALNMDAVLVTPSCCDPLCRRAVRVSMGTVFQVPWAQIGTCPADWPENGIAQLHSLGFKTAAMALSDRSVSIDDSALSAEPKLAIVLGTEGDGLAHSTIAACDYTVKIPMSHGVDSLNVAAASAVAFWQLGNR